MKPLPINDQHALAAFFALHHGAVVLKAPRANDIERVVMATFGLVAKKGPYRLTASGKRALKLAKSD